MSCSCKEDRCEEKNEKRIAIARITASAVLLVIAMIVPSEGIIKAQLYIIPYLIIGYDVIWAALKNIAHLKMLDEEFLMTIATIGAFAIGEYPEAVAVMLFFQIGELIEDLAQGRSRRSIAAIMNIRPDYANIVSGGEVRKVAPSEVHIGDIIEVRPGEKIPLDGQIIEGSTSVDTQAITGESIPRDMATGDQVSNGTVNISGLIRVKVSSEFAQSTVSRILDLVENSSEKKARTENFITRFSHWYTPSVVIGAVLLCIIPPLASGQAWSTWISRALVFLAVSCPCALVISVPLTFFSGIGGASKEGILIKGSSYLETLSRITTAVFDKTGTLTDGKLAVTAIHPNQVTEAQLLDLAAAAESYSVHPIAASIIRAHKGHIDRSRIGEVEEIAGMGLSAVIDGKTIYVGNGKLMDRIGAAWHECHRSGTVIHLSTETEYLGHIVVSDSIKPEASKAIAELKKQGVKKTVMLSGDLRKSALQVAQSLGIDETKAELLPDDKVTAVESLLGPGQTIAFIGDGINDAPVLMRSDIGIAMGAMGSDAAIEAADVVLMDDNLEKTALAVKIARKTMSIARQNIVFALGVKAAILALGAMGIAGLWAAVFGDVGVMLIAVLNSLRAMRK
ncbi:MAG: cadmium-translocating P-type ATPase [Candidatus Cloacimonetes bacterium]|nr:cadmium-translocating P-type ATPase [Candidatus Cloacimonadota bacterium]